MMARIVSLLRNLFRRDRVERELDAELHAFVEMSAAEKRATGMAPDAAHRAALLELAGFDQVKEQVRDVRAGATAQAFANDVRDAVRALRRRPLTSAAAILTLAIGIGLNAAVFSVFDWVLLRPLPYPSPQELVRVFVAGASPLSEPLDLTFSEFMRFSSTPAFRSAATFSTVVRVMSAPNLDPSHVVVARVAGDLFATLGVYPQEGRAFAQSEVASGAPVVVISEAIWRNRFARVAGIVGRTVAIDQRSHTIVGVMPAGRGYPVDADVWRPLSDDEREDDDRENVMIARLANGQTADSASLALATLVSGTSKATQTAWVDDLQGVQVGNVRGALTALLLSSALILLIACANVAALIGARGDERSSEMAMRAALGASRGRLVRQLLTENALLAFAGGIAGLVLARWTLDLVITVAPSTLPRVTEITLDARLIGVGLAVTLLTGMIVGVAPALRAARLDGRIAGDSVVVSRVAARSRTRLVLVATQTALAIVLVIAAGLLARSLRNLVTTDHGFEPQRLVAVNLYVRGMALESLPALFRALIDTAAGAQGVQSAAIALRLPTEVSGLRVPISLAAGAAAPVVLRPVTAGYFETVGIALAVGRTFTREDRRDAQRVGIVNEAFVREQLHGTPALGITVSTEMARTPIAIVGVVRDVTPAGTPDRAALYVPFEQMFFGGGSLIVRTREDPGTVVASLLTRLRETAPALAFDRTQILADTIAAGRSVARFNTQLASAFAALALLLASIGLYGLTAAEVTSRWRELAVRVALGATRRDAFLVAMLPGIRALAIGLVVGLIGAAGAARSMRSLLSGVEPADAVTLLAAPTLLLGVAAIALGLGASRVWRTDPATTLRQQ